MIYPMAALVLLTFIVAVFTIRARFTSVRNGNLRAKYFKLMQGEQVPDTVVQSTRSFNNQFEIPMLFYVVATLNMVLEISSYFILVLAWLFVLSRFIHAYIHLTYNHVLHRLVAFVFGFGCLIVMWGHLVISRLWG